MHVRGPTVAVISVVSDVSGIQGASSQDAGEPTPIPQDAAGAMPEQAGAMDSVTCGWGNYKVTHSGVFSPFSLSQARIYGERDGTCGIIGRHVIGTLVTWVLIRGALCA